MPAAFIDPVIIEQQYTWEANFNVILSNGSARNISGYTAYLTASGMMLSGIVSGTIGRVSFGLNTAQTSALNFDRIGYEIKLISGSTVEKMAVGNLVLSTAVH